MRKLRVKKSISFLLVLIMTVSMAPLTVMAEAVTPVVEVSTVKAQPGKMVEVIVSLEDNPGVAAISMNINFNSSLLSLQSVSFGEMFAEDATEPANLNSPVVLSWVGLENVEGDCTFATLTFLVCETAASGQFSEITVSYDWGNIINLDEELVDFDLVSGGVNIVAGVPGDVNGDLVCDVRDLLRLRKYFARWDVETDEVALDVNGDGSVNSKDLLRLRKYFAGWEVEIWYGSISYMRCVHSLTAVSYTAPKCEEDGNTAYWYCEKCCKYFGDSSAATEIALEDTVLAATGHMPVVDEAVPATYTSTGLTEGSHCDVCQKVLVKQEIVPILQRNEWSITYNIAGNDSYLQSIFIENPNQNTYEEGIGVALLEEPVVPGYVFEGWYDGQGSSANRVTQIGTTEARNIKLYAKWSKDTYTIQFVSSLYPIDSITYTADTGAVLPTPSLSNYVFAGWTDEEGNLLSGNIKPGTAKNMTLTANWTSERNKTWTKTQLDAPIIYQDEENNIIYFAYEIGEIQNVPLYTVKDFGYISGDGVTKTQTVTYSTKVGQTETEAYTRAVTNATTASSSWTLSDGWTNSTSINSEYAAEITQTDTSIEERATSETGNWNISNGTSGSQSTTVLASNSKNQQNEVKISNSTTDESKVSSTTKESDSLSATLDTVTKVGVSTTASVENTATVGSKLSAGVSEDGASIGGEISASDSLKTGLSTTVNSETTVGASETATHETERSYSAESSYAKTQGSEAGVTVGGEQLNSTSSTASSSWNSEYSYGGSNTTTNTETTSQAIAKSISEKTGYGEEYIQTGNQSNTQGNTSSSSEENQYSSTVAYSTETEEEVTMTWTTQSTKEGYHRWVKAGTAHVFAVVGYDIADSAYFVSTYSIMDSETHDFEDYSYSDSSYSDNENGVLSFEVPYEVTEYVANLTAGSSGLRVDGDTGIVTEYTGTDNAVIIPEYFVVDNGDGTNKVIKVTGFTENVFKGNTNIKAVVLSDFITEIPAHAFEGCTSLMGVGAKSITSIGESAFKGCVNFYGAYVSSAITTLGPNAFENVYSLFVHAANSDVVKNAVNSGADNILLYLDEMKDGTGVSALRYQELIVPESTLIFVMNGYGSIFNDVTVVSKAKGTIINRADFVSTSGIPLQLYSSEAILNQVTTASPGLGLVMYADTTELGVQGTVKINVSGNNGILSRNLALYQSNDAVVGALQSNGKIFVAGTVDGEKLMSPAPEIIGEDVFDKLLTAYTVTFDPCGGSCNQLNKEVLGGDVVGELPTPTREYYDFDGWFTKAEGGEEVIAESSFAEDTTIYAHWTANTCKLSLDANGGAVDTETILLHVGETVGELPTPTRDYYDFNGWFTTASGGTEITADTLVTDNQDYTVYAQWTQHSVSDWVQASDVPTEAQIVEQKYTYSLTETTSSSSSSMSGWTLYDTQRTSWGTTCGPVYSDPSGSGRNVWSEQYVVSSTHYYRYYHRYGYAYNTSTSSYGYVYGTDSSFTKGERHTIDLTYALSAKGTVVGTTYYGWYSHDGDNYALWFYDYEWDDVNYGTRWYYQDPVYTYYFTRTTSEESSSDPTGEDGVSDVVAWVKYREK